MPWYFIQIKTPVWIMITGGNVNQGSVISSLNLYIPVKKFFQYSMKFPMKTTKMTWPGQACLQCPGWHRQGGDVQVDQDAGLHCTCWKFLPSFILKC